MSIDKDKTDKDKYVPIDEEGYFIFDGQRLEDRDYGQKLLANIEFMEKSRYLTKFEGQSAWIEAFDAPLVARHVRLTSNSDMLAGPGVIGLPYGLELSFSFKSLSVDEWDRFHGVTEKRVPFVLSRNAQVEFFDLLDEFDDDSVTIRGMRYPVPQWLGESGDERSSEFWTKIYNTEDPGWELGRESNILPSVLPQLKLNKSRVLVLGCGSGHDAAYFASQGHSVTAVDFSDAAIEKARAKFSGRENLEFVQANVFDLESKWASRFDLIFEHALYCAISPDQRNQLVKVWKRLLVPGGDLLAVFFVTDSWGGPPFGGSEWEVRERLKSAFNFLLWSRWRNSIDRRKGRELLVYAKLKG